MADATLSPRKRPRQERARATVDAILDAATELLVSVGYDKSSTNKIAQRAGVSVGSLYQYFPNKESIVIALLERHTDQMLGLLEESVAEFLDKPLAEGVRMYVRAMIETHAQDTDLHRVIVQQVLHLGFDHLDAVDRRARELVEVILEHRRAQIVPTDIGLAAWVVVTTTETLVHRAFLAGDLDMDAVHEEVCAVVLRYLFGRA
jgi:AcrR family transcriptional regulator